MKEQTEDFLGAAADLSDCEQLVEQLLQLVGDAEPISADERRVRDRFPIHCKMQLIPLDQNHVPLTGDSMTVFGKDLSRSGISFTHDVPLSYRSVIISLKHEDIGQFSVEAELAWTRQNLIGLYESGVRMIRKIPGHGIKM